jgi:mRNA interferase YafQ
VFTLQYTGQFKKDLKRLKKRSQKNFKTLEGFIEDLIITGFDGVPDKNKPHKLIGNYKDCYECHVMNDLLLVWKEDTENEILVLIRTGTHSDLF